MKFQIEMPHVGESVTEAVIGKWLKSEGDRVEKYDAIVEVITDKVSMEVPAPASGTLGRIVATEGETVQMGAVIAEMETLDDEPSSIQDPGRSMHEDSNAGRIGELISGANVGPTGGAFTDTSLPDRTVGQQPYRSGFQRQAGEFGVTHYSPVVARLAAENGIDLSKVIGTGLGGRVTRQDIEGRIGVGAKPGPSIDASTATVGDRVEDASTVRRMIADRMSASWREIPHAWSAIEVDASGMVECRQVNRERVREQLGVDLTYLPLSLDAVAQSLREHELLNASWDNGRIRFHGSVNIGIAVATPNGLVVPVLRNADQKNIAELVRDLAHLIELARTGKLSLDQVRGGTFTLNNTGALGSVWGGAIINHPQAAILTTEAIVRRVVPSESSVGDSFAVRPMMNICISFDHRIIDGAEASGFLQDVRRRIERFSAGTELGLGG